MRKESWPRLKSQSRLIAVVVTVDIAFLRNEFWERLMANIGIVLLFAAFYLKFMKRF